jgi:DNA-binding NarL/FixJ family response regulator
MKIKVLLADDHKIFLDGLQALLEAQSEVEVLATAENGQVLLDKMKQHPAEVVLLDYNMPGMDGLECTRLLRERHPEAKVLVLSMHNTPGHIQKILKAGAHGYLLKNTGKEELLKAIATVKEGGVYYSAEVTETIMQGLQRKEAQATNYQIGSLTEREKEVLILIAEERTSLEIAEELHISKHTVETHRKNLISKLQVRNVSGLVKYAVQQGLVD